MLSHLKRTNPDTAKTIRTVYSVRAANHEQMEQIHAYYNNLYKKIAQGQMNLNNTELGMITSSDRLC